MAWAVGISRACCAGLRGAAEDSDGVSGPGGAGRAGLGRPASASQNTVDPAGRRDPAGGELDSASIHQQTQVLIFSNCFNFNISYFLFPIVFLLFSYRGE